MNEKIKLEEAKYFLSRMIGEQEHRESFVFNLSAFLSATRSVLQYARKEASQYPSGQNWYDKLMNSSPVLVFFKDERDLNIHEKPIHPKANYIMHAETGAFVTTFGSVTMTVYDKDGNIKQQSKTDEYPDSAKLKPSKNVSAKPIPNEVKYFFHEWAGNEDVIDLCQECVRELEVAIQDGISHGFVKG